MRDGELTEQAPRRLRQRVHAHRRLAAVLALPLVVAAVALTLTAFELNGSSVAILSSGWQDDPDVVAGEPRFIRSDEYLLATPAQVGAAAKGDPTHAWIGLTDTDLRVTSLGMSTLSWSTLFSPQSWPLLLLPVTVGFAARWWFVLGVGILGVYALLMALRPRVTVAVPLALAVGLSPLAAWWTSPSPGPILGFLAGAGAALVVANRAAKRWQAVTLGLLAGYLACAAFLMLYPPWFVSCGLVVAAAVIGTAVQARVRLSTFLSSAGSALVVFAGVIGVWAIQASDALSAITATDYPGQRVSEAGGGNAATLFSAPLNGLMADDPTRLAREIRVPDGRLLPNNQSEASSAWFPLPVLVAFLLIVLVGYLLARRVSDRANAEPMFVDDTRGGIDGASATASPWRSWAAPIAVSVVMLVLLAWMLVAAIPDVVGKVTFFERVPGARTTVAIGLAAALLVQLCAGRVRLGRRATPWTVAVVGVALCGPLALWSGRRLLAPGTDGVGWAVLIGLVVAACFAGLLFAGSGRTAWPFALVLGVVVLANYAIVNPLNRGLGPLTEGPLSKLLRETAAAEGPARWASLDAGNAQPVIMASRNEVLSGMTYYPTTEVWDRLAPDQKALWNNYSKYRWEYDASVDPAEVVPFRGTDRILRIDLCNPKVDFLEVKYVVTKTGSPIPPCYTQVEKLVDLGGKKLTVSRRS